MNDLMRVLLVEDNPGDADLIVELLPRDCDVVDVARISKALEHVGTERFDILLLDLGLPDSNGLDTLRTMRLHAVELPIIVMTGNNDEQMGLEAIREGAQDYLIKGQIDANLLERSIKYAVERKQAENALKELNVTLEERIFERTAQLTSANETLQFEIAERRRAEEALLKLNEDLEKRVEERTAELRDRDQMLLIQSRQAAMGEMISNIAHQWRQPLNTLGLLVQQLPLYYDIGQLTNEFLKSNVVQSMNLIKHMSNTIDDFRNYFKPDKNILEFKVSEAINNTLSLVEDNFKSQRIQIEVNAKHDPTISGFPNEYAQVLLNILNNARDVLIEREIDDPRVMINIYVEDDRAVVTISDNAGGIPEEIMGKIFDPYFTTKGPQAGTGVGLFMSKTIIEKNMGGRLAVCNIANGAEFRIAV